jgi:predicted Zn-dependent protease
LEAGLAKARSFAENDRGDSIYDVVSAELYENAGRGKEALALLNRRLKNDPKDFAIRLVLAGFYLEQKSMTAPSTNIRASSPNPRLTRLR